MTGVGLFTTTLTAVGLGAPVKVAVTTPRPPGDRLATVKDTLAELAGKVMVTGTTSKPGVAVSEITFENTNAEGNVTVKYAVLLVAMEMPTVGSRLISGLVTVKIR